ncbi:MAG: hypothetical protein ACMG6H_01205, partial [Acidobacteriota bacterium]
MKTSLPNPVARAAAGTALLVILLLLMWNTGRSGFASLLTSYAAQSGEIGPANLAVSLNTKNPDAHYVLATILEPNDLPGAVAEFYQAALARPEDYV